MKKHLSRLLFISLMMVSCYKDKEPYQVIFDWYIFDPSTCMNTINSSDSIVLQYTSFNDSVYQVSSIYQEPIYVYETQEGLFESIDKNDFFLSFAFQDTLPHSNLLFPYEYQTNVALVKSKLFTVDGKDYLIYLFVEDVENTSHSGGITYYIPNIGVILISTGETPGSGLLRRFGKDEIGRKLIEKLQNDTTFFDGHTMKNPVVKIDDFVFSSDLND